MKKLIFISFVLGLSGCTHADSTKNLTEKTYCELVEQTINLPALQEYFHVDVFPKRSPLTLSVDQYVSACSNLVKFGTPINILSLEEAKKHTSTGYLKFAIVRVTSTYAEIEFKYAPEGIIGDLKLELIDSSWVVSESRIVET